MVVNSKEIAAVAILAGCTKLVLDNIPKQHKQQLLGVVTAFVTLKLKQSQQPQTPQGEGGFWGNLFK